MAYRRTSLLCVAFHGDNELGAQYALHTQLRLLFTNARDFIVTVTLFKRLMSVKFDIKSLLSSGLVRLFHECLFLQSKVILLFNH